MMLTKSNRKPSTVLVSNVLLLIIIVFGTPQYLLSSSYYHHYVVSCLELSSLYSKARYIRTIHGHDAARPFYKEILEINNKNNNNDDDDLTAACHIAGHIDSIERHCQIGKGGTTNEKISFINKLRDANYHPDAIADLIFHHHHHHQQQQQQQKKSKALKSSAPLYIQPLRAGDRPPPLPSCPLGVLIQLFLMAVCLPIEICKQYLGNDIIDLFETLGVAYRDNNLVVPYIHIMPINLNNHYSNSSKKTIYLATDLHPNVLSTTTINDDGAVMYIGPDSLALIDHWTTRRYTQQKPITTTGKNNKIVDICTGSGIQAICLSAMTTTMMMMPNEVSSNGSISNDEDIRNSSSSSNNDNDLDVICIDINPRAIQFTELNFEWNGLPKPTLIQGDILAVDDDDNNSNNNHSNKKWESILQDSNIIVANPPFLPVPVLDDEISKRYGLFSSGGESGEIVLKRIVELASKTLTSSNGGGMLAIVSEFMNPQTNFSIRLQRWWEEATEASASPGGEGMTTATDAAAEGILFTNEIPIVADTYAERRADSIDEKQRWMHHLAREGITHISPGLLFIKKNNRKKKNKKKMSAIGLLTLSSYLVPHSDQGSIWTPTNDVARTYTNSILEERRFY